MMTAESMLSKRSVLRISVVLFSLLLGTYIHLLTIILLTSPHRTQSRMKINIYLIIIQSRGVELELA